MSGTSLDGVDAALVDIGGRAIRLISKTYLAYDGSLRQRLLDLHLPGLDELHRACLLANELSALYARAALELISEAGPSPVKAIGCHGQTVRHRPEAGYTVQLVNGALIAEHTGLTTVVDFRGRDIAAGGQGAPLVPAFHSACFRIPRRHRAVVNIGGIANVTDLPPRGPVRGFDTGPGNILLDAWARRHFALPFDPNGKQAAHGHVSPAVLDAMLGFEYFQRPPPKSTGRETFGEQWLDGFDLSGTSPQDIQATLAELSARTIAAAIQRHCPGAAQVVVCGGGVHNLDLMRRLARCAAPVPVASSIESGVDPDWVEAMAFAWLAARTLAGLPGSLAEVTGATGARVLGAIYRA